MLKDTFSIINRSFKRIVNIGIILIVILVGLSFSLLNSATVSFNYYLGSIDLQLSLLLVITLVIGAILGVAASFGIILKTRHEVSRARREAKSRAHEVNMLRAMSQEADKRG